MYDLPSEDPEEPGLPDEFHDYQPQLLRETFQPPLYAADHVFVATDLNLYYDVQHPLWHKRPDWFVVLGASRLYDGRDLRLSYVIWQEQVVPYVIVELLSPGTEDEDLGRTLPLTAESPPTKWMVYEQILGVPYYVVFSRYTQTVQYFELADGVYRTVQPPEQRLWLPAAGLGLGLWSGRYQGVASQWLRCYDAQGEWIATPAERAEQAQQQIAQAQQQAIQERQRAERLAAQLRALGIEPES
jgi:Uma2 family endonuclease